METQKKSTDESSVKGPNGELDGPITISTNRPNLSNEDELGNEISLPTTVNMRYSLTGGGLIPGDDYQVQLQLKDIGTTTWTQGGTSTITYISETTVILWSQIGEYFPGGSYQDQKLIDAKITVSPINAQDSNSESFVKNDIRILDKTTNESAS